MFWADSHMSDPTAKTKVMETPWKSFRNLTNRLRNVSNLKMDIGWKLVWFRSHLKVVWYSKVLLIWWRLRKHGVTPKPPHHYETSGLRSLQNPCHSWLGPSNLEGCVREFPLMNPTITRRVLFVLELQWKPHSEQARGVTIKGTGSRYHGSKAAACNRTDICFHDSCLERHQPN